LFELFFYYLVDAVEIVAEMGEFAEAAERRLSGSAGLVAEFLFYDFGDELLHGDAPLLRLLLGEAEEGLR
jgi:hypothetical protein